MGENIGDITVVTGVAGKRFAINPGDFADRLICTNAYRRSAVVAKRGGAEKTSYHDEERGGYKPAMRTVIGDDDECIKAAREQHEAECIKLFGAYHYYRQRVLDQIADLEKSSGEETPQLGGE